MAKYQQKATMPPAEARADRDAHDVSTGVTDTRGGAVQTAPLQPSSPGRWFDRTWQHLFVAHLVNGPDEIVAYTQSPSSVSVRLSNGAEYCLSKGKL